MRDNRDPQSIGLAITDLMAAHGMSALEAADLTLQGWSTIVSGPPSGFAERRSRVETARQNGAQERTGSPEAGAI